MRDLLFLVFLFLVFLFPVAVYLTVLAGINRRDNPLMISGVWDAAGIIFASSGFLLAAGPAILASTYYGANRSLYSDSNVAWLMRNLLSQWWLFWGAYYLGIVGGSVIFLWWRRLSTVIYNVEKIDFDSAIAQTLENLNLQWVRQGNQVFFKRSGTDNPHTRGEFVLKIDPFPLFCNVSISWSANAGSMREDVETELQNSLARVQTRYNPSSGWLIGVSGALFGVMLVVTLVLLVLKWLLIW